MKKLFLYLIISTSLIACSTSAPTTETATAPSSKVDRKELELKLKGMEAAWNLSGLEKDFGYKVVEETISDDFSHFNDQGVKQNKAEVLKSITETKGTITEVVNGDMSVIFYSDNVATIVGSHVTKGKDEAGKEYTTKSSWTDTFMERNGKWQCIASGTSSHPQ